MFSIPVRSLPLCLPMDVLVNITPPVASDDEMKCPQNCHDVSYEVTRVSESSINAELLQTALESERSE